MIFVFSFPSTDDLRLRVENLTTAVKRGFAIFNMIRAEKLHENSLRADVLMGFKKMLKLLFNFISYSVVNPQENMPCDISQP